MCVRRVLACFGAPLAAAGAACTFLAPLDYLTDGTPDVGDATSDARPPADAPVNGDGALDDAEAGDARAQTDATDAGSADATADTAPLPFCASMSPAPAYCADFDEGSLTAAYEHGVLGDAPAFLVDPGGHVALSDGGLSRPGAFVAAVDAVADGGTTVHARIDRPVMLPAATSARLEFAVRVDPHGLVLSDIASVGMHGGASAEVRAYYVIHPDHAELDIQGSGPLVPWPLPMPLPSAWTRVELALTIGAQATATVTIGGVDAGTVSTSAGFPQATDAFFTLGLASSATSDPVSAAFDDVVFSAQ
jgi:hypothetical protein